jgi:hypothetical protein
MHFLRTPHPAPRTPHPAPRTPHFNCTYSGVPQKQSGIRAERMPSVPSSFVFAELSSFVFAGLSLRFTLMCRALHSLLDCPGCRRQFPGSAGNFKGPNKMPFREDGKTGVHCMDLDAKVVRVCLGSIIDRLTSFKYLQKRTDTVFERREKIRANACQ